MKTMSKKNKILKTYSQEESVVFSRTAYRKLAKLKGVEILNQDQLEEFIVQCIENFIDPQVEIAKLTIED
jgi:hypothetical protein